MLFMLCICTFQKQTHKPLWLRCTAAIYDQTT